MKKDVLYSNGELDVLFYYSKIAPALSNFLKDKKIASKIHLPHLFFLRRGSNNKPLDIEDLKDIDNYKLIILILKLGSRKNIYK